MWKKASRIWKHCADLPQPLRACSSFFFFFFDRRGIVHYEFFRLTPNAGGINGQRYLDILKELHVRIAHIRPELFTTNSWVLHHDNAPPHTSHVVADSLVKSGTTRMLHSPYSPNMAPCDCWAFPEVKKVLKNAHWRSIEEIERVMAWALKTLT